MKTNKNYHPRLESEATNLIAEMAERLKDGDLKGRTKRDQTATIKAHIKINAEALENRYSRNMYWVMVKEARKQGYWV